MPLKTHLFAANGAGDEGHILGLVGRFQGDFVDVVDQRFAVDGARRLLVAHVVDALRRRQEPILRKKKTNKQNKHDTPFSFLFSSYFHRRFYQSWKQIKN